MERQQVKNIDRKGRMAAELQPRALLFLAALTWMTVGLILMAKGAHILAWNPFWLAAAVTVGTVKAFLVLDRLARRNVARLQGYSSAVFVGRMFARRTWIIIAVMILLGRLLRLPGVAPELSGFFSLAVGWGLFLASRLSWRGWLAHRKQS